MINKDVLLLVVVPVDLLLQVLLLVFYFHRDVHSSFVLSNMEFKMLLENCSVDSTRS
jgi:hypothetical protein